MGISRQFSWGQSPVQWGEAAPGHNDPLQGTTIWGQGGAGVHQGAAQRGLIASQFRRFCSPWVTRDFFKPVLNFAGQIFDVGWTCNSPQQPAMTPDDLPVELDLESTAGCCGLLQVQPRSKKWPAKFKTGPKKSRVT